MIFIKTPEELEKMRAACDLVSRTLGEVAKWVAPGITTHRLDTIAREFILDNGGKPACLGYQGFPGTLCIEVNETVVHGFPSNYTLREGDIIGTDCVAELNGYNGDSCYTFQVGEIDPKWFALLQTTKESLYKGIEAAQAGKRIGDISNAVQTYCEHRSYSVVREMCGHGIGRDMHEDPEVPNYGHQGRGPRLVPGMTIAIEPMICQGDYKIKQLSDGWTVKTKDGGLAAHFEHSIAILKDRTEIMTRSWDDPDFDPATFSLK